MSYLLDTDVCVHFLNRRPEITKRVAQCLDNGIAISLITLAELRLGAHNSDQVENNLKRIEFFLDRIQLLNLTPKTTHIFAEIKAALKKSGDAVDDFDIFIAATAIENDLTLVTDNERHFTGIERLNVINWLK